MGIEEKVCILMQIGSFRYAISAQGESHSSGLFHEAAWHTWCILYCIVWTLHDGCQMEEKVKVNWKREE